jgi:hypothetical protein
MDISTLANSINAIAVTAGVIFAAAPDVFKSTALRRGIARQRKRG